MLSNLQMIILGGSLSAVVVGLLLIALPYSIIVYHLSASRLRSVEGTMGLFALRASFYMLVAGLAILAMGFLALLFVLPFTS